MAVKGMAAIDDAIITALLFNFFFLIINIFIDI
jgi:hypothetical protein